jgi:6-phosphogluconolactonase
MARNHEKSLFRGALFSYMIGEWIEIRDIFKLLSSSAQRTMGHSTIFVVAKPEDHLYYLESFTKNIITEYPSRYILIKEEANAEREFLKAKLTFLETAKGSNRFCEFIEIEFTKGQKERLATSLSKFALPKLDVFLVIWQKENEHKPFFDALKNISTRVIFDAEYALDPDLILKYIHQVPKRASVGDLSYTRAFSIREILIKELTAPQLAPVIDNFHTLKIRYNPCQYRCSDIPIQSLYLAQWLAIWAKLNPLFKTHHHNHTKIFYNKATAIIEEGEQNKDLGEGKIMELEMIGPTHSFLLKRDKTQPDRILTSIKAGDKTSDPASFKTDDLQIGLSLMRQLQYDQTNQVQLEALKQLCDIPYKRLIECASKDEVILSLKQRILFEGRKAIQERGVFRIALSGGKTPIDLYRSFKATELDWNRVVVFFSDERQVAPDNPDSNYKNAMDALQHLPLKQENIHRMVADRDPDTNAYAYEMLIKPYLDVCLLGLGSDGHTLSVFPNSPALEENLRLVITAPGLNYARMTFTIEALKICKNKFFLVIGEDKREILTKVLSQKSKEHPASLVLGADFYTDLKGIDKA